MTARANVSGGCTGAVVGGQSGSAPLSTSTFHMHKDDPLGIVGSAPIQQTNLRIAVDLFGIQVPIQSRSGRAMGGSIGPFDMSGYSTLFRSIALTATTDSCVASMTIVYDDVNPFLTVAGGGGVIVGIVGVIGLELNRRSGGKHSAFRGIAFGVLAGMGWSLFLQQMAILDATNLFSLFVVIVAGVVGYGVRGHREGTVRL